MRILITGSEGFLGKHIVQSALNRGHEVFGVDTKIGTDVRSVDLKEFDVVIHLAAYIDVADSFNRPWDYVNNNIIQLDSLAKAKRVVFASSAAVYGNYSPYGYTKRLGEDLLPENSVSLRLFNPFGPGENHEPETHIIPILASGGATLYNNGAQVRDFIYVGDAAEAFVKSAELGITGSYDLCDTPLTIKEVADLMDVEYTLDPNPRDAGDTPELIGDARPLQKALFLKPKHNVKEEIKNWRKW